MTPATHSPGTSERRTATGVDLATAVAEERRRTAIAALLHRISGGLNNASMAFELALGLSPSACADERVLQAGLGGVGQAARAVALLSELLTPGSTGASHGTGARLSDVIEMLRASATLRGVGLRIDGEPARGDETATTPALAVASLLEGLAAIDQASGATPASLAATLAHGDLHLRRTATAGAVAP
jgi:hypothetical protein